MKKILLAVTIFAVAAICSGTADAQFTITIPKIKIKKEKPQTPDAQPKTVETTTAASNNADTSSAPTATSKSADWRIQYHIDEINKLKTKLDEWVPADTYFPTPISNDDYYRIAVSPAERASWFKNNKWTDAGETAPLVSALNALKVSLVKRLPENGPDPKSFTLRNAPQEKLLVAALELPGAKIFKIGFDEPNWLIDKNEYGLPTARYKHGMIYGRNPAADDGLCRFWYINVIQDYSGGGTYGASYGRYIKGDIAPCPAGN
jgi:hypothetical protein